MPLKGWTADCVIIRPLIATASIAALSCPSLFSLNKSHYTTKPLFGFFIPLYPTLSWGGKFSIHAGRDLRTTE